ncbi:MAG: branched-chain amino acid ABC transporter permease [Verrucomicrobia bacterium]|nr:branched-chain amino acid ABC transporter permease [Verrucomicrobiota bacterium]MBV8330647.1 branched-chain amino acid ABC transporter permease [Verrucomicrobiota bacterium]
MDRLIEVVQQLINGISLGSIYALIALGYTMVYGVLRFINFAHGDIYMLGAYSGYLLAPLFAKTFQFGEFDTFTPQNTLFILTGASIVMLLSMAICGVIGVLVERIAYRPLRERPRLNVLITAIGVSLFLQNMTQFELGADPKAFPQLIPVHVIEGLGNLTILTSQLTIIIATVVLLIILHFVVMKTKIGLAMRALSLNPTACSIMGVNNDVVVSFTFALGSALAGAAGILVSIDSPSINPLMGNLPGIKAFVAAVLGGIGNIAGAALGGLIIGILETLVVAVGFPEWRDGIAFAVLIVILLFKPTGLLGRVEREKV